MKTMNGFTNELLVKKARRNWRTRCGAFLLAIMAAWAGGDAINPAHGQIIITGTGTNANNFDNDQRVTQGDDNSPNIGYFVTGSTTTRTGNNSVSWTGGTLDLNHIGSGLYAARVNGDGDRVANYAFQRSDTLEIQGGTFSNSGGQGWYGTINVTGAATFSGSSMTVYNNNGSNSFNVTGNLSLTGGSDLTISSGGMVAAGGSIYITNGALLVDNTNTSFTNNGDIYIQTNGSFELGANKNLQGTGTVHLASGTNFDIEYGATVTNNIDMTASTGFTWLNLAGNNNLAGNVRGSESGTYRANISLDDDTVSRFTAAGSWSGQLTVTTASDGFSGLTSYLNVAALDSATSASDLLRLRITGNADVLIDNQNNIGGADIILEGFSDTNYGRMTKLLDGGALTITNDITVAGIGGLGATGANLVWDDDGDVIYDANNRLVVTGILSSSVLGATLHVNPEYENGAIVLQNTANTYRGGFVIHDGALEISDEAQLGVHNHAYDLANSITIGDTTTDLIGGHAAFRVVMAANQSTTIGRWIILDSEEHSFYEVYTSGSTAAMADADRATVIQTGPIRDEAAMNGGIGTSGNLNKYGDGRLVLAAATNDYTGDTIIWHGALSISRNSQINTAAGAYLQVGVLEGEDHGFRPVFQTELAAGATDLTLTVDEIRLDQSNSTIRTTGSTNNTIYAGKTATGGPGQITTTWAGGYGYLPSLNKDGAGTFTIAAGVDGNWGTQDILGNPLRDGKTNIHEGTLQFYEAGNLSGGDITIGTNTGTTFGDASTGAYKDLEAATLDDYKASLQLGDDAGYVVLNNLVYLNHETNSYIGVGKDSWLEINGAIRQDPRITGSADLNKDGEGTLIFSVQNDYTGWTNIHGGTIEATVAGVFATGSSGLDLYGEGAVFDMSAPGADQTLNGLRGGIIDATARGGTLLGTLDDPDTWTRKILIGDNTLTLDIDSIGNMKANDPLSVPLASENVRAHIMGTGDIVKLGDGTLNIGFGIGDVTDPTNIANETVFSGTVNVLEGTLGLLSNARFTGLGIGDAGTTLDLLHSTLTLDLATDTATETVILSSIDPDDYTATWRPHLIKTGEGNLKAAFTDGTNHMGGDLTLMKGNIISTTDYVMDAGSTITFYATANAFGGYTPLKLTTEDPISKQRKAVLFEEGTYVDVVLDNNGTALPLWTSQQGKTIVGIVEGNSSSSYGGLSVKNDPSMFYSIELNQYDVAKGIDLQVELNVTGFGGLDCPFNSTEVGKNLDNIRTMDGLFGSGTFLETLINNVWTYGEGITTENYEARKAVVCGLFKQLSGDTIANATTMGFSRAWARPFDRLNLDAQVVYSERPTAENPRPKVRNTNSLWITPSGSRTKVGTDGNARGYKIDTGGFQLGWDKRVAPNTSVGFAFYYDDSKLKQEHDKVDCDNIQLGVYGGTMLGSSMVEVKGYFGVGHQDYDSRRSVVFPSNVLVKNSYGGYSMLGGDVGMLTANGGFQGDSLSFAFEISRPFFIGGVILRPYVGLDTEHLWRYGFQEDGDEIAMEYGRSSLSRTRARLGMTLETRLFKHVDFTGRIGYSGLLTKNDYAKTTAQFIGIDAPAQTVRSVAVGKNYLDGGFGGRVYLNPSRTWMLEGNYTASCASRWEEHIGDISVRVIY